MKRIVILTSLLVIGLIGSQAIPLLIAMPEWFVTIRQFITMTLLAYIMIEVGREFDIDLKNKRQYAVDYGVAATAAAFPWIFCTIYFLAFLMPDSSTSSKPAWVDALLAARFAAPTSAGVLFSMLAAAGLAGTWAFRKTRILAIFDDLDTFLFMIPLKVMLVGFVWQLGIDLVVVAVLLFLGLRFYRKLNVPTKWYWIIAYSFFITALSEIVYYYTIDPKTLIGAHIDVLLPAFLLGCSITHRQAEQATTPGEDTPGLNVEERVGLIVSGLFMLLVGLSMPAAIGPKATIKFDMSISEIIVHVILVTVISNIGKMFAYLCYKKRRPQKSAWQFPYPYFRGVKLELVY